MGYASISGADSENDDSTVLPDSRRGELDIDREWPPFSPISLDDAIPLTQDPAILAQHLKLDSLLEGGLGDPFDVNWRGNGAVEIG
jgi:hypothetical protein